MPDIYPYGRDAPEGTYFAERRGGFDRGGGGPGEEWDPGSANNSATASAAAELARMWATAPFGVEPDATNYPGFFSSLHYATIVQNFLDASADTQVLFNDGGDIVGNADLTFNKISGVLRMPGGVEQLTDATTWLAYRKTSAGAPIGGLYGDATGLAFHTYDPVSPGLPTATFGGSASGLAYITYTDELAINRGGGSTVLTANQDGKFLFTPYVPNQVTIELYEGQLKLYTPYSNYIAPLNIPHGSVPAVLNNGDIWTTTSGVFARVNGSTVALGGTSFNLTSLGDVEITAVGDGDLLSWDAGTSKWVNTGALPPPNWGVIGGTLSDQTDLQTELDGKSNITHTHDGIKFTYGATFPTVGNTPGDRFVYTTTGKEYTWVDDGDSEQWVELYAGSGGGGSSIPLPLAIESGGTGQSSAAAGLVALAGGATANRVLRGNGSAIVLAQVALATDVTGVLPVANGGSGQSSAFLTSGTWTPAINFSGNTQSLSSVNGTWYRVGDLVYVYANVTLGTLIGSGTDAEMTGLPFAGANLGTHSQDVPIFTLTLSSGITSIETRRLSLTIQNNSTAAVISIFGGAGTRIPLTRSNFQTGTFIQLGGVYRCEP